MALNRLRTAPFRGRHLLQERRRLMASLNDIRSTFLDYFRRQGHAVVDSSPLVPRNDPTLMFTNSGMVQFKNVFTGLEHRDYSRATTAQKCVRAGGKHNDLDNVGYTARHHTFFEMLGNFSFGDYFKSDAIPFAWELLTKDFAIPKDRLLVTVYHTDDEAANIWKKVAGLTDDRIIRIPTDDNFWRMGPTGPCGPCTEIFFDHGDHIWGGPPGSADEDGDRFIEIWNLVFMQNEQLEDGRLIDLPRQSIDTGMGLERIGALLQGKHDNYDTDLMRGLIEASANATNGDPDGPGKIHHRVIADHLRSVSFLIADGVMPSNEGRGYVLRRIMRRAMRHAHMLGAQDPVMHRLVPALVRAMGGHYTELKTAEALITETLRLEETRFRQTLDRLQPLFRRSRARLHFSRQRGIERRHGERDLGEPALRHRPQNVDVALDERRFGDDADRMIGRRQHFEDRTHRPIGPLDRLIGIGIGADGDRARLVARRRQFALQQLRRAAFHEQLGFEIEPRRQAHIGMCRPRETIDAAVLAAAIGIDRAIE